MWKKKNRPSGILSGKRTQRDFHTCQATFASEDEAHRERMFGTHRALVTVLGSYPGPSSGGGAVTDPVLRHPCRQQLCFQGGVSVAGRQMYLFN